MKKFTFLSILLLFFGLIAAPQAQAGHPSRVISKCGYCKQSVYAYYRPVSYHGYTRYMWVPVYHTTCQARARAAAAAAYSRTRTYTKYHRGTPYNYIVPTRPSRSYYPYGYSPVVRPGISITIRK